MLMKKLSEDHYIVVDDSEIKEGDWVYQQNFEKTNNQIISIKTEFQSNVANDKNGSYTKRKITHSTQPESLGMGWMQSVQPLFLSEVKELLGVVDVEKKVMELYNNFKLKPFEAMYPLEGATKRFVENVYNQALEDNKEKKYTRNEVHALMCKAFEQGLKKADVLEAGLEVKETDVECAWILTRHDSTPKKTEWEVEFVDGKLKLKS